MLILTDHFRTAKDKGMNDNHGVRPHVARRAVLRATVRGTRLRRLGLPACVLSGAALLAAACGGSANSTGSTPYAKALAYSQCMRANGVPKYPDPDSQGQIPLDARDLGVSPGSPQFVHATTVCAKLAPSNTISPQQQRQDLTRALKIRRACALTGYRPSRIRPRPGAAWL